jgi:hypothetical protein
MRNIAQRYRVMASVCTWVVCDSKQANKIVASFALRREAREHAQQLNNERSSASGVAAVAQLQND